MVAQGTMINHRGGRDIVLNDLALIEAPPPTDTWFPISHFDVFRTVNQALRDAGYEVAKQRFSVSNEGHRFFGIMDLQNTILDGVSLSVGIRNSTDKSFPIGFCCGQRVFVCDNLAFTSEIVVTKKHTRFGADRYVEGLSKAVASLGQYQESQKQWIGRLRSWHPTRQEADSFILRAYEEELIGARQLPLLIEEWRKPSYDQFRDNSAWSLWNCFTTVLGRTMQNQPGKAALTTIKLQAILQPPEVIDGEFKRIEVQGTEQLAS